MMNGIILNKSQLA